MAQDELTAKTLCPFFRRHTPRSIICEGPTRSSISTLRFTTDAQRRAWQRANCCRYSYWACPLCVGAARKYDEPRTR